MKHFFFSFMNNHEFQLGRLMVVMTIKRFALVVWSCAELQLCTVVWAVRIEKVALVVGLSCAQVAPASVCIALESCEIPIFFFYINIDA